MSFQACLLYPYMPNGTLETKLRCRPGTEALTGDQRWSISAGIASGLNHLHSRQKPLIHRDIKTSNILLNDHCVPKVGQKTKKTDGIAKKTLPNCFCRSFNNGNQS